MSELKMGGSAILESGEDESVDLDQIREELEEMKAGEKSGDLGTAHFVEGVNKELDIDNLRDEDLLMWDKIKNYNELSDLTKADWDEYAEEVEYSDNEDSVIFKAFLANKITPILMNIELAERKRAREQNAA